ncbi:UDP-N-acetylglucosamine 2-epimerase [Lacticaseibacillus hulanensis]|uniref:UDP-N-acetylglucosamine 2-epimerase n=1 Tax=Lacticaseibacillus hulanensis TaxID=2493111 RepID=UPI0013E31F85
MRLVGTDPDVVSSSMIELLDDADAYAKMAGAKNPYGDGFAAERILDAIAYSFGLRKNAPQPFEI